MSAHTPGPWTAEEHLGRLLVVGPVQCDDDKRENYQWLIAEMLFGDDGMEKREAEANARLIAAAPRLLYALRATVAEVCADCRDEEDGRYACGGPQSDLCHAISTMAWPALAEAEGEGK